ncbi:MAG: WD40 repeat domain-containing protein, partial [Planctomycetaceae bacterium]
TARAVLAACPEARRNWEWGRLWFLANRSWNVVRPETRLDAIAVSVDGRQFVTGGWNGKAQVWDSATGQQVRTLSHTGQYVHAAAYSPDGRLLATAGNDREGRIRLWNALTGDPLGEFDGHSEAVLSLAFAPDSRTLASGAFDNTVRLWDLGASQSRVVGTHFGCVWALAFSPDGSRLASASHDGTVTLWPLGAAAEPVRFLGHEGPVYAVAYSPDGKLVASGGHDRQVLLWNPADVPEFNYKKAASGRFVDPPKFQMLAAHRGAVRGVAFDASGRQLVSGAQDNAVCLWDVAQRRLLRTLRGHGEWVRACAFDPTGTQIYSASFDGSARVWRNDGQHELEILADRSLQGHADAVLGVNFARAGDRVVTASRDRSARTWDFQTGRELVVFEEGHQFLASNAAFQADGSRLFTAAVDNTVRAWDVATGTEITRFEMTGRAAALAVSGNGQWLLTGGDNPNAGDGVEGGGPETDRFAPQVWNISRLAPGLPAIRERLLSGHKTEVTAVAFSADSRLACTGDAGGKLLVWRTSDWTVERRLAKHTAKITAAVFTPDGRSLLSASLDNTVEQWDLATGSSRRERSLVHPDGVSALVLATDGKETLTACADGHVRLWNLADAQREWELPVHSPEGLISVAAHGGRALTIDSKDREARVWDLAGRREIKFSGGDERVGAVLKLRDRGSQRWG